MFFGKNLQYLRKLKGLNQGEMLDIIGIKRTTWGGYENGTSFPKFDDLLKIAEYFDISETDLIRKDLSIVPNAENLGIENKSVFVPKKVLNDVPNETKKHQKQRLSVVQEEVPVRYVTSHMPKVVTVDSGGIDNIVHIPIKARAGYLLGYGDPAYIEGLPSYKLPGLRNGTFRSFEVEGLSMTPGLYPGDIVIGEWCESLNDIRDDRVYIIVTKESGIVIKRVLNRIKERGKLYIKSDNSQFPTMPIEPEDVQEIWYARLKISNQFSSTEIIYKQINDLMLDVMELKQKIHL